MLERLLDELLVVVSTRTTKDGGDEDDDAVVKFSLVMFRLLKPTELLQLVVDSALFTSNRCIVEDPDTSDTVVAAEATSVAILTFSLSPSFWPTDCDCLTVSTITF